MGRGQTLQSSSWECVLMKHVPDKTCLLLLHFTVSYPSLEMDTHSVVIEP